MSPNWYLDETEECPLYRVEVRDGDDAGAPLMGSYCGSRAPPHLTTQGSAMFVQAMVLHGGQIGTFSAVYSVLNSGKFHRMKCFTVPKNSMSCILQNYLFPENCLFILEKSTFHNLCTLIFNCEIISVQSHVWSITINNQTYFEKCRWRWPLKVYDSYTCRFRLLCHTWNMAENRFPKVHNVLSWSVVTFKVLAFWLQTYILMSLSCRK